MPDASPELVLAPNTVLQDATGVPGAEAGDMILDRPDRREHAKLVSAEVGALLELFRTPRRLPDAIAVLNTAQKADPFALLEQAAPVVAQLRSCGILQTAEDSDAPAYRFGPGVEVGGHRIHRVLRQTGDTEVALATGADGGLVALKTVGPAPTQDARDAFLSEIGIARRLSGSIAPEVVDLGPEDGAPVLATRWIDGLPLDRYVAACCATRAESLALARRVIEAYAALHAHGILHGDIRPSNILIDGHGRVRILDFGLSQRAGPDAVKLSFELAYMEPEAAAVLRDGTLPPLTPAGEVYSLALVLAEAIGGRPARNLPALRDDALAEIATQTPAIRTGWPAMDRALQPAAVPLADGRAGLSDLMAALERIEPPSPAPFALPRSAPSVDAALLALRCAEVQNDAEALAAARRYAHMAERPGDDRSSPLYSPMARAVLRARVAYAAMQFEDARHELEHIADIAAAPRAAAELFDGSAGDLAHLARLVSDFGPADGRIANLRAPLRTLLESQMVRLDAALDGLDTGAPTHLGMAHGLCGQAYAGLVAARALNLSPPRAVARGLQALAARAVPVASGLAWPGTIHPASGQPVTADFSPGWCAGSAGLLLLWIAAAQAFPDGPYRRLADGAAHYALGHPDRTDNLCCGRAGRAVALSVYARWTASRGWQRKARDMAGAAGRIDGHRSVFRGQAGIDLARLETAALDPRFPI